MWYLRILASSAGLCIMSISLAGSFANALLAGANTVKACMELRLPVSPAILTSAAKDVSSGLCLAAVTTGAMLMPWKLPIPVAGTIPQSDPNLGVPAMGGGCGGIGWWVAAEPAAVELVEPQPAAASASTPAAAAPVSAAVRRDASTALIRTVSPPRRAPAGPAGRPAARPGPGACRAVPHTRYSAPAGPLIGHTMRPRRFRRPGKTAPRW